MLIFIQNTDFLSQQRHYPRVREAISQKLETIELLFKQKNISFPPENIFIRIFKEDQHVELWVRSSSADTFQWLKSYTFCSTSGTLGPKRMQGDMQIPEGFYYINRYNPSSNFYLSLGIDYPNASDRILGKKGRLGGDIFIHGNCVTIGCIPITDELIKELYVIAIYTKNNGQDKIPVHIFPFKMVTARIQNTRPPDIQNIAFWNNLQPGYSYFEEHHKIPKITVDKENGDYLFNE